MMNQQQCVSYTHIFSILEREGISNNNNKFKQLFTNIKQQEQKNASLDDYLLAEAHNFLASLFIDSNHTYMISRQCKAILPLLVSQLVHQCSTTATEQELHDRVTCALSKTLPLYPQFLRFIIMHLKDRPSLLDRVIAQQKKKFSGQERTNFIEILKAAFRLLHYAPEEFSKMWNWSPFFSLLEHPDEEVKWYTSRCVSLLLQYESVESNVINNAKSFSEKERFLIESGEEEELYLNQVLGMHAQNVVTANSNTINNKNAMDIDDDDESRTATTTHESKMMVSVCGVWLPKKKNATNDSSLKSKLVFTETTSANMRAVALAVSQGSPVLLEGITGSGKTAVIEELAHMTGNTDLIKVNLDESFDSKDLLGTYVCTDVPGEFRWQPGALTKAVTEGRWILIEDLDLAPFDIVSAIIPLIESNSLFIPSRDEVIPATTGFHIFATQSMVESFTGSASRQRVLTMANLWTQVHIEKLPSNEIEQVLQAKYAPIAHLTSKFLDTYETLRGTKSALPTDSVDESNEMMEPEEKNTTKDFAQLKNFGRLFSFRDLLKWCGRVNKLYGHKINKDYLVTQIKKDIFHEAVDVFCGMIVKKNVYNAVVHTLAKVWGITDFSHYLDLYKPQVTEGTGTVTVGRISLARDKKGLAETLTEARRFAHTKASLRLMERCAACVHMKEPVLLTGETGTGKTSIVQHLATLLGKKLVVHNLNQQTDSADFIGGFKPVDLRILALSLKNNFEKLFSVTFSVKQNSSFLVKTQEQFDKRNWSSLVILFQRVIEKAYEKIEKANVEDEEVVPDKKSKSKSKKRKNTSNDESARKQQKTSERQHTLKQYWDKFSQSVDKFNTQQNLVKNSFAFSFVEGTLVKALKEGHWILLDEINLASTETLERLSSLLDGEEGTLFITEKGDTEPVKRHPDFRLFACMNPPTDIGKKNLPPAMRNRFTEFYVNELTDPEDLKIVVSKYLEKHQIANPPTQAIVDFYLEAKAQSEVNLSDGAGHKPHYSLRTLSRSLEYASIVLPTYGLERALYEGFCMGFLTLLSRASFSVMEEMIRKYICKKSKESLNSVPRSPGEGYVQFEHFWLKTGQFPIHEDNQFIITPSVQTHLKNLARALKTNKYPILLQGPTSAGKTSMVSYLAKRTGHRFVRINNHESTDLQEYFGTYITNSEGKLVFQEGILVEAVRNGYWIVLDELNLAPSDILEALNRLLDDNRELFIPETQEIIKPHPHFQLFATQNPPGLYGGRKVLSRAFRNRFLEFHVDDIPGEELKIILQRRCGISARLADRMVSVMKSLQTHRQSSKIFAGKGGFITPRDLFRWAERVTTLSNEYKDKQQIAEEGYMLLAERLRRDDEKVIVKETLEKCMSVKLDTDKMYDCEESEEFKRIQTNSTAKIVWTKTMRRLFTLVGKCLTYKEPVLLVGETGCGKTTICQIYSEILNNRLHIINCHQHTETSDFLGSLRPVRGRETLLVKIKSLIEQFAEEHKKVLRTDLSVQYQDESIGDTVKSLEKLCNKIVKKRKEEERMEEEFPERHLLEIQLEIRKLYQEWKSLFIWYDGPLVEAMNNGDLFLIDEISLAEDAVLERLNSVLEPSRELVLPEKGSEIIEEIKAHDTFRVMATMNPGGDFGKKELSPALRNRFTEIYVPTLSVKEDLALIIASRLSDNLKHFNIKMVDFVNYFRNKKSKRILSIRDVISWIDFMNLAESKLSMSPHESYVHGAEVVILEGVGIGTDILEKTRIQLRNDSIQFLISQVAPELSADDIASLHEQFTKEKAQYSLKTSGNENVFGFHPFFIEHGPASIPKSIHYSLNAPTTSKNVMKVLRALQLRKPLLLEGSPGVGKTSLIQAIAKASGHNVVRINLSEQTDMMDLLGSDLPVDGAAGGQFRWSDGIFLSALKAGDWVLLDELNLASQSVLEGLNSVLDHRAEIYIPELNRTFSCPKSFRIFAAQNPLQQGGGRKGLPKSFLNRFTQVYVEQMQSDDLLFIAMTMHGEIGEENLRKMIKFNELMYEDSMVNFRFARKGSPWEFNLRDVFRWCELLVSEEVTSGNYDPSRFIDCIYRQRMRTEEDRLYIANLYERVFGNGYSCNVNPSYTITERSVQIGQSELSTNLVTAENEKNNHSTVSNKSKYVLLHHFLNPLENVFKCIQMNYMCILTGPSGSGKTSLVRLAAQMTGNILNEFSMSSSTDTVELLGTFEQVDPSQKQRQVATFIKTMLDDLARMICTTNSQKFDSIKQLYNDWTTLQATEKVSEKSKDDKIRKLELLRNIVRATFALADELDQGSDEGLQEQLAELDRIEKLIHEGVKGRFAWNDGTLIRSMEAGHWILIDNVNFCNPTVLDRLNGLLEPNGVLVVNERGLVDGEIKVVKPHHHFRIFMVMDPKYGEISRAMRNRGIEISLMPMPMLSQDAFTLLSSSGVQSPVIINKLMLFHNTFIEKVRTSEDDRPTIRDILRCAEVFMAESNQGSSINNSLKVALTSVYIRNKCLQPTQKMEALQVLDSVLSQSTDVSTSLLPSSYLSHNSFKVNNPKYRSLLRQGALLYYTAQKLLSLKLESQLHGKQRVSLKSVVGNLNWPTLIAELSPSLMESLLGSDAIPSELDKDSLRTVFAALIRDFSLATEYFVSRTPLEDVQFRSMWLDRLKHLCQGEPDLCKLIEKTKVLLTQRTNSHLAQQIRKTIKKNVIPKTNALPVRDVLPHQALDLRLNHALYKKLEYAGLTSNLPDSIFERASIMTMVMSHKYDEEQFYQTTSDSLIHKSLSYSKSKKTAKLSETEIIHFFYPLIQAIDQLIDVVLQDNDFISLDTVENMFDCRAKMWSYLSQTNSVSEEFLIYWHWFSKSVHNSKLDECKNSTIIKMFKHVCNIIEEVDQRCNKLFDTISRKNILWKIGGHPKNMTSAELKSMKVQIERFIATHDIVHKPEIKSMIIKAMCTINWLNSQQKSSGSMSQLGSSIADLPNKLEEAFNGKTYKENSGTKEFKELELEAIFEHIFNTCTENEDEEENKQRVSSIDKHTTSQLLPLYDFNSMAEETELLALITDFNLSYRNNTLFANISSFNAIVSTIASKLRSLIDYVVHKTSRSPLDMVPYQSMLWNFDSITLKDNYGEKEKTEILEKLDQIPSLVHEMWLNWNHRLWDNSFNKVEQFKANTDDISPSLLEGPNRLFQDINSVRILSILRDWHSVPIRARFTKIDQLKKIVEFMCGSSDQDDVTGADWKHVLNTFCDTLVCFKKSFANPQALDEIVHDLLKSNSNSLSGRLSDVIKTSSDPRLVASHSTIVEIGNLLDARDGDSDDILRARIWVLVGVLRLKLIIPGQSLDPARKYAVAVEHLKPAVENMENKIDVFSRMEHFINGSHTNIDIESFKKQLSQFRTTLEKVEDKVVHRAITQPFKILYKDMKDFVDSLVPAKIESLLKPILALDSDNEEAITDILVKEDMLQNNMSMVSRNLLNNFDSYADILVPFATSVFQIKYGLRLLAYYGTVSHSETEANQISNVTKDIVSFPSTNDIKNLGNNINLLNTALSVGVRQSKKYERYQTMVELVRVQLSKLHLFILGSKNINEDVLNVADMVFSGYSALFKIIDDETQQHEKEQEELYKYKEQTTVIETDEELLAKEIEQMFPTFLEHYEQFVKKDDTVNEQVTPSRPDNKELKKLNQLLYDPNEVCKLVDIHKEIYGLISRKVEPVTSAESARAFMFDRSMQVAGKLISSTNASQSIGDSGLLPFILYGSQAVTDMTEKLNIQAKPDVADFDIYSDSNIPEVSLAFNTLLPMVQRFNDLLKKYEKHPTLIQMVNICERILDLPVSSPIVKVLTGLEVLLVKANEWQEYLTSPAGSIKEQMLKLTTLIIRWRKMELDNWRSVLVTKRKEFKTKAIKWWFRFYRMINLSSYGKADDELNQEELNKAAESFLSICDDFMRTSSVGEFVHRLDLLPNFYIQIQAEMEANYDREGLPSELKNKFLNILFNTYKFYDQFRQGIETKIENEVKPIEEKLKGFVKLMKWEDVNVDGLRQSTNKSRRQLGKFSKGFNEILVKPARDIWDKYDPQDVTNNAVKDSKVVKKKKLGPKKKQQKKRVRRNKKLEDVVVPALSEELERLSPIFTVKATEESNQVSSFLSQYVKLINANDDELLTGDKLNIINNKIEQNLSKYVLQNHKVMADCDMTIDFLEDLSTTVINRMKDLQKPGTLVMIKKRALGDLLKELKLIGISSLLAKVKQQTAPQVIFEQPLAALQQSGKCQENESLWIRADNYYYRSIYGLQNLRHIYENEPSEDLNDKERRQMMGYSENLFLYLMKQRSGMSTIQEEQEKLNAFTDAFNSLKSALSQTNLSNSAVLPSQTFAKRWTGLQLEYFTKFYELVEELSVLFQSLKTSSSVSKQFSTKKIDTLRSLILEKKKQLDNIQIDRASTIITSVHLSAVTSNFNQMMEIKQLVTELEQEAAEYIPRCKELTSIMEEGVRMSQEFAKADTNHPTKKMDVSTQFKQLFSDSVKNIQLSVQMLIKQFQQRESIIDELIAKREQNQEDEEDKENLLFSNELKEKSVSRLYDLFEGSFDSLAQGLSEVNKKIAELHSLLVLTSDQPDTKQHKQLINVLSVLTSRLQPIMKKLILKIDLFKYPFLSFHKSLSKLEYILLSIFSTLFKEGFCSTEEGEGEGEGQSSGQVDFSDGQGMDDGEGINDVTDQIENEDQIMDAKDLEKQDQQKKQPKEDDAVEVETDFDGKLDDVDKQEKNDDESEDEEDDEDMDKDMGEIDDDDPNKQTLDKKLWDENDEDDQDDREDENNDGSNANERQETELQAKEEETEEADENNKKSQKKEAPQIDPNQEEEEVEQEEYQDVVTEDQMRDQNQDEQNNDEQDFQLPDQMDLDEGDEGSDEESDSAEEGEDGQSDAEEGDEGEDQAPEPLSAQREDDVEDVQTEDAIKEDDIQQSMDEEDDEPKQGLDPSTKDENKPEQDENADGDEDMGEKDENEEDKNDEEEEKQKVNTEEEEAFQEDLKETPFGVQQTAGKASEIKDQQAEEDREEKKNNEAEEESGKDTNKSEYGESFDKGSEDRQQKKEEKKSDSAQFDPNPYRSLGDALKEWKEKLNMVENEDDKNKDEGNDGEQDENDDYEFAKKDQEQKEDDMQVLSAATQEQADAFPELENRDDEESSDDEENERSKDIKNQEDQMTDSDDEGAEDSKKNTGRAVLRFDQNKDEDEDEDIKEEDMVDAEAEEGKKEVKIEDDDNKMPSSIHASSMHDRFTEIEVKEEEQEEEKKPLTMEDIQKMREELDVMLSEWRNDQDKVDKSKDAWKRFDMITSHLSQELCEQLRLILEPTLATKLKGDYKTGKRINMKKVIPYIASQFRKDKIWLRRTKPNKRQYQVLLAIDDSKSMGDNHAGQMACEAVTLISKAMSQLEVGQLAVVSFGEKVNMLHPFDRPFSDESGSELLAQFTFNQNQTQIYKFMQDAVSMLDAYKSFELVNNTEQVQLAFIISDGRMLDRESIVKMVRQAQEKRQLFVFILIDNPNPKDSILELKSVTYPNGKLTVTSYIDQFPFPYYIILRDIQSLPEILADALRQFFELLSVQNEQE